MTEVAVDAVRPISGVEEGSALERQLTQGVAAENEHVTWLGGWRKYPWDKLQIGEQEDGTSITHQGRVGIVLTNAAEFPDRQFCFEYQKGLFAVADGNGKVLGSFLLPWTPAGASRRVEITGTVEVLEAADTFFTDPVDEETINRRIGRVREFFLPDGFMRRDVRFAVPPLSVPIEFTTHVAGLIDSFPNREKDIVAFLAGGGIGERLVGLWSVETAADLNETLAFTRHNPERASVLFSSMLDCYRLAEDLGTYVEVSSRQHAVGREVVRLGRELVRSAIHDSPDPAFRWEYVSDAISAIDQILQDLYSAGNVFNTALAPETYRPGMSEYLLSLMHDANARAFVRPVVMARWMGHMRHLQEAKQPEEQKAFGEGAKLFYPALKEWLTETASETTADTERELARLFTITEWLVKNAYLTPNEASMGDWGCGDMRRILVPYLAYLKKHYGLPKTIVGVDMLPQTVPPEFSVEFHLADLSDPQMTLDGRGPFHLITSSWSVPVDMGPLSQPDFFRNLSLNLISPRGKKHGGVAIVDIPLSETYRMEMDDYYRSHPAEPYGTFTRTFSTKAGERVTKKFYLPPKLEDLVVELDAAGLRIVTQAPGGAWVTKEGVGRITLVLEKLSDPRDFIHRLWYGSSA